MTIHDLHALHGQREWLVAVFHAEFETWGGDLTDLTNAEFETFARRPTAVQEVGRTPKAVINRGSRIPEIEEVIADAQRCSVA